MFNITPRSEFCFPPWPWFAP